MNSSQLSSSAEMADIQHILLSYSSERCNLIPILQDVQEIMGYIFPAAVDLIARHLSLSPHDIFGVASFFSQFRFQAPGKHCLKVCQGTACHVRGSALLVDLISRRLHIEPGETTGDREYSLERVMCVGSCALAPVVVCDDVVKGRMTQKALDKLIDLAGQQVVPEQPPERAAQE